MKKIFTYGLAALVISISFYNITQSMSGNDNLSLLNLAGVEALAREDCEDDELDQCFRQDCGEGENCECTMCQKGNVDCTPTCPCC